MLLFVPIMCQSGFLLKGRGYFKANGFFYKNKVKEHDLFQLQFFPKHKDFTLKDVFYYWIAKDSVLQ